MISKLYKIEKCQIHLTHWTIHQNVLLHIIIRYKSWKIKYEISRKWTGWCQFFQGWWTLSRTVICISWRPHYAEMQLNTQSLIVLQNQPEFLNLYLDTRVIVYFLFTTGNNNFYNIFETKFLIEWSPTLLLCL